MKPYRLLLLLTFFAFSAHSQVQIWGVAPYGGSNGTGTIFCADSSGGNFTKAYDFPTSYPGHVTWHAPTLASDGYLYGVVNQGGLYNYGGIYKYDATTSTYSLIYNFHDSENVQAGLNYQLIEYNNSGVFYGMSMNGGANGTGFIFKFDINTSLMTRVANFDPTITISYTNDNATMGCALNFFPVNGKYYGACKKGGKNGSGFIFEFDPVSNTLIRKLEFYDYPASFQKTTDPYLTFNSSNNYFIGTSTYSGSSGVVYEYDPIADTAYARANLTATTQMNSETGPMKLFTDGKYYSTAKISPGVNNGGICAYDPIAHTVTSKFSFSSSSNYGNGGGNNLIDGGNGKYYGTCTNGGISLYGCLFEYNPSTNTCAIKYSFSSTQCKPYDSPILLPSGKLLGVLTTGAPSVSGTMYTYNPSTASLSMLFNFESAPNGKNPMGSLIQGANGKLYGTTRNGGAHGLGVLFEIDPTTLVFTNKYDFTTTNGDAPHSQLILGNDNKIYGITDGYTYAYNSGVIFQYDPATSTYTKKYSFPSGSYPTSLICLANGNLIYGNAGNGGGPTSAGNLYEYNITTNTYTIKRASVPNTGLSLGLGNNIYGGAATLSILKYDISAAAYSTPRVFPGNFHQLTSKLLTLFNGELMGTASYYVNSNYSDVIYKYNPFTNSSPSVSYTLPSTITDNFFYCSSLVQSNNMKVYGLYNNYGVGSLFEYNVSSNAFATRHAFAATEGIFLPIQGVNLNDLPLTLINANNPTITSQPPPSLQLCVGQSFTLNTAAAGTNLKYQWYKNGTAISGDTLDSLAISSVVLSDAGYYSCLITGNNGFISSNVTNVTINTYPTVTVTATQNPICQGSTSKLTATGASTYTWSANAGSVTTSTVNLNPATTTIYTVNGANGTCASSTSYTLNVTPNPTVTISAVSNPICSGQTFTLIANGASTYSWSPVSSATNTLTFASGSTGTWSVTGTQNGCSMNATITVTVNPVPSVNAISNRTVCANSNVSAINFSSSPTGASFNWTNSDTAIGITASGTGNIAAYIAGNVTSQHSGIISVTPTLNGCVGSQRTFTVTTNPLPAINIAGTNLICAGTNDLLTGTGTTTYTWSSNAGSATTSTVTVHPTTSSVYTLSGTSSGCTASNTFSVNVNPLPNVGAVASQSIVCAGTGITLAGSGAATYTWSNGVNDGVQFTPSASQTYTVTGTDMNNCVNSASIAITVTSLPNVYATATSTAVCLGSSTTLNGGGATTYTWSGGVSDGVSFSPASSQTYTVTGTDNNGCINSSSISVAVQSLPNVTVNATQTLVCAGTSVILTGGGANSYTWSGGINDGISFSPSASQTYTVSGSDNNGCVNSASILVTVNPLPNVTANASQNPVCAGGTTTLTGGGASTYTWSNSITDGISFTPSATQTFSVTGTDNNNCVNSATILVTVNSSPNVTANATQTVVCAGANITLTGSGAATYVWTNGVVDGNSFTPSSSQTYSVTGTDINGCTGSTTIFIKINALPNVAASTNASSVCNGDSVTLTGSGALNYSWSSGVTDGIPFAPASSQTYTLTGTDSAGCVGVSTVTVALEYCVWPGDADENLSVDNADLLPIGIKFGQTGPSRNSQDNFWNSHLANDWSDTLSNGKNVKYSDCNGDGTIDMSDTLAINLNYGNTHAARIYPSGAQSSNPDIFLLFNKSYYYPGDTLYAFVNIGTSSLPQNNFYGSAFTLNYDPTSVQPGSEEFYFNNSWVGNINQTKIKFAKTFPNNGKVDASLVRITHTVVSGYGKVATLKFILSNSIGYGQLSFTISNAVKTDQAGNLTPLNSGIDSVLIMPQTTGINKSVVNQILLFPNPSHNLITVQSQSELGETKIYNSLGEIIFDEYFKATRASININDLPDGIYTLNVRDQFIRFIKE